MRLTSLVSSAVQRVVQLVRAEAAWGGRALRRAWAAPGQERDLVIQSGKAALAAALAWLSATWLLSDEVAVMAPWVAVVLVQATIYRSVARGIQQTVAITLGTMLATVAVLALSRPVAAMLVVLPLLTLAGNWRRLGDQGIYGSTSALFTLAATEVTVGTAAGRVAAAVLGALLGIGVNALLLPPLYLRNSRESVYGVAREAREILDDIANGLHQSAEASRSGEEPAAESTLPWDRGTALTWHNRARRLPRLVRGMQSSIGWARESMQLHPDPRRRAEYARMRPYYEETLQVLEETADHVIGLTRTLLEAAEERESAADDQDEAERRRRRPEPEVIESYASFLHRVAAALGAYGRSVTDVTDPDAARDELRRTVAQVRSVHRSLRTKVPREAGPGPEEIALFGSLLAQARGLTDPLVPTAQWPEEEAPTEDEGSAESTDEDRDTRPTVSDEPPDGPPHGAGTAGGTDTAPRTDTANRAEEGQS